jgi:hypothetical protein
MASELVVVLSGCVAKEGLEIVDETKKVGFRFSNCIKIHGANEPWTPCACL